MRAFLLGLALLASTAISAQNIVSNGGFENFSACPQDHNNVNKCVGWDKATSFGTSDYFNECCTGFNVFVPNAFAGYQWAASGAAYMGLLMIHPGANWEYREYITTAVPDMQPGATYVVSMDVSFGNEGAIATHGPSVLFYVDNLGVNTGINTRIARTPQVEYGSYGFITDTANWVHLVDTFVADSAYKHIVIGNFKDSSQTPKIVANSSKPQSNGGYYYIDNVVIDKISSEASTKLAATSKIASARISPNPFSISTTISFDNFQRKKHCLNVYNIQGRLVQEINDIITSEVRVERNDLSAGCYFYELKSEDGASVKGKLFIQ